MVLGGGQNELEKVEKVMSIATPIPTSTSVVTHSGAIVVAKFILKILRGIICRRYSEVRRRVRGELWVGCAARFDEGKDHMCGG